MPEPDIVNPSSGGTTPDADEVDTDTSSFDNILSIADTNVQLALDTLDDHTHDADEVDTDTSSFDNILSIADTNVQLALDTLDDHTHSEVVNFNVHDSDVDVAVADGKVAWNVPALYNGWVITAAVASVYAKGVTSTTDIQIRRFRAGVSADVLSTKITIGDEYFAADGVIDTDYDDLATGDMFFIDVDQVHSGTAPKGLFVNFTITKA